LTVLSTNAQLPCLWGALTSTFSSLIYTVVITYIKPDDFDWRIFLLLHAVDEKDSETPTPAVEGQNIAIPSKEAYIIQPHHHHGMISEDHNLDHVQHPLSPEEIKKLKRAGTIAAIFSIVILLLTWVVWPLPLYRNYIFNKAVSLFLPQTYSMIAQYM